MGDWPQPTPSDIGAAPIASPVFTGNPTAPTPSDADGDTSLATTLFGHRVALLDALVVAAGHTGIGVDRLVKSTMGNTTTTIYTVPASTRAIITSIHVFNTGTNGSVGVYIGGSAAADQIVGATTWNNLESVDLLARGLTMLNPSKPISLNAGDTIVLVSAAGSGTPAWNYVVSGILVPDTSPILPTRMGKATVTTTASTLYTVPAGKRAIVTTVFGKNLGTNDTVNLYMNGSAAGDQLLRSGTITGSSIGDILNYADANPTHAIAMNAGDTLQAKGTGQSFAMFVSGVEVPA